MDKLIEEMEDCYKPRQPRQTAKRMISVIRKNVHLVAEICPCVHGWATEKRLEIDKRCPICKGHGVIAKGK